MKGFVAGIEQLTDENADFRRVLYTGNNLQLVLMAIQPGDGSARKSMMTATNSSA